MYINVTTTTANVTTQAYCSYITENDVYDASKMAVLLYQGVFMCCGNLLLLLPILAHDALRTRKEYVFVAALATADVINGLAYVLTSK